MCVCKIIVLVRSMLHFSFPWKRGHGASMCGGQAVVRIPIRSSDPTPNRPHDSELAPVYPPDSCVWKVCRQKERLCLSLTAVWWGTWGSWARMTSIQIPNTISYLEESPQTSFFTCLSISFSSEMQI
jgi:hypothetical protein